MPKYRYVGSVAREFYKGDKCPMLAPGEFVELSAEDMKNEHNKEAEENGLLLAVDKGGK